MTIQLDTRKTLLVLATILTLAIAYYLVAKIRLEREHYDYEQTLKEGNRLKLDACLAAADADYQERLQVPNAEADFVISLKKDDRDACYKRYGDRAP